MRPGLKPLGQMIAAAALAASVALAAPVRAQGRANVVVAPSESVAQADATLVQVTKDRTVVNEEFAASEKVCYSKFFVNNCLDKAKEKRRAALVVLRAREVEAQHYKRVDSVAKRDADLAERARKDAEEQALRAAQPPKPAKVVDETPPKPASGPSVAERVAEHDAKVKRQEAKDAAAAGQRAANVEAFQNKQVESQRRQAEVARKLKENAEKAAAKQADDKRKADAAAAAAAASAKK